VRLVVQRVRRAAVRVDGEMVGEIGPGAVILAAIAGRDSVDLVDAMADKLLGLRYFDDQEGRTNLALADVRGELLVVSQFTLLADLRRGRRPSFGDAARPDVAEPLVDRLVERLRAAGVRVATGRFAARMSVELENEGPFTLLLDSDELMNTPRRRRKAHGQ
jgi:D-tyrosyl-tRNA(Tyr) deacylase